MRFVLIRLIDARTVDESNWLQALAPIRRRAVASRAKPPQSASTARLSLCAANNCLQVAIIAARATQNNLRAQLLCFDASSCQLRFIFRRDFATKNCFRFCNLRRIGGSFLAANSGADRCAVGAPDAIVGPLSRALLRVLLRVSVALARLSRALQTREATNVLETQQMRRSNLRTLDLAQLRLHLRAPASVATEFS